MHAILDSSRRVIEHQLLINIKYQIKLQKSNPTDGITTSNTKYDEYMNHSMKCHDFWHFMPWLGRSEISAQSCWGEGQRSIAHVFSVWILKPRGSNSPSPWCLRPEVVWWIQTSRHRPRQQRYGPRWNAMSDDKMTNEYTYLIPQTISDWPRLQSPAAKTPSMLVLYFWKKPINLS